MSSIRLNEIISNILQKKDGIYYAEKQKNISYPDKGNKYCFEIEDDSFWFQHRSSIITHFIKQICPHSIFFDIGGGNGYVTKALQNQNIKTVLIEPGFVGATNAKFRGVDYVINSTFQDVKFKTNSADAIGLFDVLEHLDNDVEFLLQIKSVMSKGSYLFITVPAYHFLWSNDDVQAKHYRRYSLKKLEQLLASIGFTVFKKSYLFSFLTIPIFIFKTLPDLFVKVNKEIDFESKQNIHQPKKYLTKFLHQLCKAEFSYLNKGKSIPFGSSCFIVASLN